MEELSRKRYRFILILFEHALEPILCDLLGYAIQKNVGTEFSWSQLKTYTTNIFWDCTHILI